MSIVLALDLSSIRIGYAAFRDDQLIARGVATLPVALAPADRCRLAALYLRTLIARHGPTALAYEEQADIDVPGSLVRPAQLRAILATIASETGLALVEVPSSDVMTGGGGKCREHAAHLVAEAQAEHGGRWTAAEAVALAVAVAAVALQRQGVPQAARLTESTCGSERRSALIRTR